MINKIYALRKKYQGQINAALGISLVVVWVFELLPTTILPYEVATAYSYSVVTLFLLLIAEATIKPPSVEISADHISAHAAVTEYISQNRVKTATFILFAGGTTIRTHVEKLLEDNAHVILYSQHPNWCNSGLDKERIVASLNEISYKWSLKSNLEVYLYHVPAAFRAVALDDRFLVTSWYTHHDIAKPGGVIVRGHTYPHIITRSPSRDYINAKIMLDRVLTDLSGDSRASNKLDRSAYGA